MFMGYTPIKGVNAARGIFLSQVQFFLSVSEGLRGFLSMTEVIILKDNEIFQCFYLLPFVYWRLCVFSFSG